MDTSVSPEFSRIFNLNQISEQAQHVSLQANDIEKSALAKRFSLKAIDSLQANIDFYREGTTVVAHGRIKASVIQNCSATGLPLPIMVDEDFALRFQPEESEKDFEEEIELSPDDCDTVFYSNSRIDLGEAVAETLLLVLPSFPRHPDADQILTKAGVLPEEKASPFSILEKLKAKTANK
ncbi:DUF177 domain-containing protein [Zymomonas mobilis subsp. mobilis ZM4 = ATCC 31821]|uniref:DUF177 domain-containing protein n=2 Tax=Zymomonas mobilis subsp. mobilis TaxID=120045 RepID=Q5NL77_ZYMMO|nr:DUF177 domain-containing protein [Zymomonas mobilis]AAV90533.1 protein of unknown function DUF177 [Zymomonas mobilis subsp. mobilis ZM4 = ATCC 31821]ACV75777.1 protein of unknown function DUF177 [Zymomonas mobilis subsp. mobilis NCIMB 11163]AEH63085.1 protein of unknown function DUF177 [Zymomonas mobilis subsp. mobilis ATCC 10988]AHB10565.1 putative metal-binding protein, possibly nucleic-acid binding protein [Zymomonas mobilis subsp. mobilis str. CP4 = NRRL B-14023]AHJ70871.1 putative ACR 